MASIIARGSPSNREGMTSTWFAAHMSSTRANPAKTTRSEIPSFAASHSTQSHITRAIVKLPGSVFPQRRGQRLDQEVLPFRRRIQTTDAGEAQFAFGAQGWPRQRNVIANVHWTEDDLCIGVGAADLLLGQPAVSVRDEVTALSRGEGETVPPGQVVGIPDRLLVGLHDGDERQPPGDT